MRSAWRLFVVFGVSCTPAPSTPSVEVAKAPAPVLSAEPPWSFLGHEPSRLEVPLFVHATAEGVFVHVGEGRTTSEPSEARVVGVMGTPPIAILRQGPVPPHAFQSVALGAGDEVEVFAGERRVCHGKLEQFERVAYLRALADDDTSCLGSTGDARFDGVAERWKEHWSGETRFAIVARVSGCDAVEMGWGWARRAATHTPRVLAWTPAAEPVASELEARSRRSRLWQLLESRVRERYQSALPETSSSAWIANGWASFHLSIGDTYLWLGPDEANLWNVWHRDAHVATILSESLQRVAPIYVGSFDEHEGERMVVLLRHTSFDDLTVLELPTRAAPLRKLGMLRIHGYCPS